MGLWGRNKGCCWLFPEGQLQNGDDRNPSDVVSAQDFAVSTVPVSGTLHLRSFCSMAASDTVVIGSSDVAKKAMKVTLGIFGALLEGL